MILFHHNPKCSGLTINSYLEEAFPAEVSYFVDPAAPIEDAFRFRLKDQEVRYKYELVYGHGADWLREYVHPEMKSVTTWRDPVERVRSWYYFSRRTPEVPYLYQTANRYTLKECLLQGEIGYWNHLTYWMLHRDPKWVLAHEELAFSQIMAKLASYDFVGRADQVREFMEAISGYSFRLRNWQGDNRIVHAADYFGEQLDEEEIELILKYNRVDMLVWKELLCTSVMR